MFKQRTTHLPSPHVFDCVVLFAHHDNNPVVRRHLDILRTNNPYPVIPVCPVATSIEGSVPISGIEHPWREADLMLYGWFAQRTINARRYIYVEWDCLATLPLAEYFSDVWDESAVGNVQIRETNPSWYWWRETERMPPALRPYATGLSPLNCIMLSHRTMLVICNSSVPKDVFCEVRIGTKLRACGIDIKSFNGADNGCYPSHVSVDPLRPPWKHAANTPLAKVAILRAYLIAHAPVSDFCDKH